MRAHVWSPPLLIAVAVVIALVATAPFLSLNRATALDRYGWEVLVQGESPFQIHASRLAYNQNGIVTLETGERKVAAFMGYQVVYAVRTGVDGTREFDLRTSDGSSRRLVADRFVLDPAGTIRFEADGQLVGIVSNNYLRYVVDVEGRP
jgi:hypothetical protein